MAFCPFCGNDNDDAYVACVHCGELLPGSTNHQAVELSGRPASAAPIASRAPRMGHTGRTARPNHTTERPRTDVARAALAGSARPAEPTDGQKTQFLDMSQPSTGTATSRHTSRIGTVKLVVEQGMILGEQFLLNDQLIMVGRFDAGSGHCPDIDLSAQDPSFVHRQHARIEFDETRGLGMVIHDLGGRNGVYVNNVQVPSNGSARFELGDKLRVGRVVMRVHTATD